MEPKLASRPRALRAASGKWVKECGECELAKAKVDRFGVMRLARRGLKGKGGGSSRSSWGDASEGTASIHATRFREIIYRGEVEAELRLG